MQPQRRLSLCKSLSTPNACGVAVFLSHAHSLVSAWLEILFALLGLYLHVNTAMPVVPYSDADIRKKKKLAAKRKQDRWTKILKLPFVSRALRAAHAQGRAAAEADARRVICRKDKYFKSELAQVYAHLERATAAAKAEASKTRQVRSLLNAAQKEVDRAKWSEDWHKRQGQADTQKIVRFLANGTIAQRAAFHALSRKAPQKIRVCAD